MNKQRLPMLVLALTLCVGAFLFPMTAYAATDTTPPTVNAWLNGDTLHIEAGDSGSGVETIYIDSRRVNFLVDGAVEVNARDYHDGKEKISIYALDFAGNKSGVVTIANPYYKSPASTSTPAPTTGTTPKPNPTSTPAPSTPRPTTPASSAPTSTPPAQTLQPTTPPATSTPEPTVTPEPTPTPPPSESGIPDEQQPFTPSGQGTTVDNVIQQNGKEFFTIVTENENTFYLIVDRVRDGENVYLLNAVTEDDLKALSVKGSSSESAVPTPAPTTPAPTEKPDPTPAPEPEKPDNGNNMGAIMLVVLAALGVGGAGYYFKILKPKRDAASGSDAEDDYDDPDDYDETEADDEEEYETDSYELEDEPDDTKKAGK